MEVSAMSSCSVKAGLRAERKIEAPEEVQIARPAREVTRDRLLITLSAARCCENPDRMARLQLSR